jgi:hypothetical protein
MGQMPETLACVGQLAGLLLEFNGVDVHGDSPGHGQTHYLFPCCPPVTAEPKSAITVMGHHRPVRTSK